MANVVRVETSALEQCAVKYKDALETVKSADATFQKAIEALNSDWTGMAYEIMRGKVNAMNRNIQRSFDNIEDAMSELYAVAQHFENVEDDITGTAASQETGSGAPFTAG